MNFKPSPIALIYERVILGIIVPDRKGQSRQMNSWIDINREYKK